MTSYFHGDMTRKNHFWVYPKTSYLTNKWDTYDADTYCNNHKYIKTFNLYNIPLTEFECKGHIISDKIIKLKLFDNTFPQNEDVLINNKFTFIQIPKTSSTTIYKAYLTKYTIKTIGCNRHEGLLYLENFIINDKLPVYAVVRNPFYHIHSYFFHRLKHKEISLWNCKNIIQNFEMFVREEVNNIHLQQCRYIKSNKNIKVKLFKFENKDIYKYLEDNYGIKFNTHHNVNSNPLKNKYKHINIKEFFANDDIVKLILKYRKDEFEMFGYSTKIEDLY